MWGTRLTNRREFTEFIYKNVVVKVVREVRKERHLNFLTNIKEERKGSKEEN